MEAVNMRQDIYKFVFRLMVKSLFKPKLFKVKEIADFLMEPMDYWRIQEIPQALSFIKLNGSSEKVLDIGSPKLSSLYLASTSNSSIHSTDLIDYFIPDYEEIKKQLNLVNLFNDTADATKLKYSNEEFDYIFSISVIEHIYDDSVAMKEIARCLKPGGSAIFTFPYHSDAVDEYHHAPYWSSEEGIVFYQHRYNQKSLEERIIGPSGLQTKEIRYFSEKPMGKLELNDGVLTENIHKIKRITEFFKKIKLPIVPSLISFYFWNKYQYAVQIPDQNTRCILLVLEKRL
ncbi:class I SAM-dependent methyltransferase [Paenibacillus sp. SI8]|uniref:class I SAM-dependent methyltransferase n=1 Tax=unclassified Paenibacillus TaxID=185978 RepID=UPI003467117B